MIRDKYLKTLERLTTRADFQNSRILEIGCGSGRITSTYANKCALTIGIEPNFSEIQKAVKSVPSASFVCSSGMTLPFVNCFDIVIFTLSLHHHPIPDDALDEARKSLVPDGLILVLEPTIESDIQKLCNFFENEDQHLENVERILKRSELKTTSCETFKTLWIFDDFEDLADYAFNYYDQPRETGKITELKNFLDEKADNAPIELTDTLRLTCLRST